MPTRDEPILDAEALSKDLEAAFSMGEEAVGAALKQNLADALFQGRKVARQRLEAGQPGLAVAAYLAQVMDTLLVHLFQAAQRATGGEGASARPQRLALVAVGGYGRGQMAPGSDVDLLFLRAGSAAPSTEAAIRLILFVLWDLGLKVGHASRTIDECLRLAREDHTIETALLESRFVTGDTALGAELQRRFRKDVSQRDHSAFIAAKLRERDERLHRVGGSRYMVEPNLKDGKGGLRDLQVLSWMARHCYGFDTIEDYVNAGVLSVDEANTYRRSLEFLWKVRCHLHYITGRAEERLTFDLQPELAKRLGFAARGEHTEVERFMKRYFLVARQVGTLTRVLCARLEADQAKSAPRGIGRLMPARRKPATPVAPGFHIEGGRLNIDGPDVLDAPANVIRLFTIAEKHDVDVHPVAFGEAGRRARLFNKPWRRDEDCREAFLAALESKRPAAALRLMSEAGVLGQFIPEFGRVVAQMQFNMYHHFTVDEHTLRAIEAISEIERGRHEGQHPLSTSIFPKIVNRRALYLAMLLHDTGKGEGDQQIEGEKAARAACERLGLSGEEVDLVAWLVRHHLLMSDTAQKRDIGDARTVAQFASVVGTIEKLRLLLVLTVADIRAVGPGVWNDWKGQLLRDLYRLTEVALRGGSPDEETVREHLREIAEDAKRKLLEKEHLDPAELAGWIDALEDGYWLNHDAEALRWHAQEVRAARTRGELPHVAARIREVQGVTEVLIYAKDRVGLFASLAAAISASGANIAGARVHTTKEGAAFDIFSVQTSDLKPFGLHDAHALRALRGRLARAAVDDHPMPAAPPPTRRGAVFAIEPWVRIDNDIAANATVIEASGRDRLGLLAELAHVCAEAKASIVSAHIDTYGERASDVFYVQEDGGGQLAGAKQIQALRARLEAVLRAGEPGERSAKEPLAVARASTAR